MTEDIKKAYLKRGATIASVAAAFSLHEGEVASLVAIGGWDEQKKQGTERADVDWTIVEKDYTAGIKTLRQIADEHGVTHGAINKRAKRDGWSRNLQEKIAHKAESLVSKTLVSKDEVSAESVSKAKSTRPTEAQIVEANAEVIALADLTNRKDVILGIDISRGHLEELAALSDPRFKDDLERLGDMFQDDRKAVETFRYIISLPGRIKMAKDAAASMGTYIPMQRKILKLDAEANKSLSDLDNLLAKINGTQ
jgi:hypothetical protein